MTDVDQNWPAKYKWGLSSPEGHATVFPVRGGRDGRPSHRAELRRQWGRDMSARGGDVIGAAQYTPPEMHLDGSVVAPGYVMVQTYYGEELPPEIRDRLQALHPGAEVREAAEVKSLDPRNRWALSKAAADDWSLRSVDVPDYGYKFLYHVPTDTWEVWADNARTERDPLGHHIPRTEARGWDPDDTARGHVYGEGDVRLHFVPGFAGTRFLSDQEHRELADRLETQAVERTLRRTAADSWELPTGEEEYEPVWKWLYSPQDGFLLWESPPDARGLQGEATAHETKALSEWGRKLMPQEDVLGYATLADGVLEVESYSPNADLKVAQVVKGELRKRPEFAGVDIRMGFGHDPQEMLPPVERDPKAELSRAARWARGNWDLEGMPRETHKFVYSPRTKEAIVWEDLDEPHDLVAPWDHPFVRGSVYEGLGPRAHEFMSDDSEEILEAERAVAAELAQRGHQAAPLGQRGAGAIREQGLLSRARDWLLGPRDAAAVLDPAKLKCPETGKTAYVDEATAMRAIERAWTSPNWVNRHGRMPTRAYQCPDCGWWHMTSAPERSAAAHGPWEFSDEARRRFESPHPGDERTVRHMTDPDAYWYHVGPWAARHSIAEHGLLPGGGGVGAAHPGQDWRPNPVAVYAGPVTPDERAGNEFVNFGAEAENEYIREMDDFTPEDLTTGYRFRLPPEMHGLVGLSDEFDPVVMGAVPPQHVEVRHPETGRWEPVLRRTAATNPLAQDGAMVAFFVPPAAAASLAVPGGEPADELHVTLVFFEQKASARNDWGKLTQVLRDLAGQQPPVHMKATELGSFPSPDNGGVVWAAPEFDQDVAGFRERVVQAVEAAGFPTDKRFPDWKPHITLTYGTEDPSTVPAKVPMDLGTVSALSLNVAESRSDFPLGMGGWQATAADNWDIPGFEDWEEGVGFNPPEGVDAEQLAADGMLYHPPDRVPWYIVDGRFHKGEPGWYHENLQEELRYQGLGDEEGEIHDDARGVYEPSTGKVYMYEGDEADWFAAVEALGLDPEKASWTRTSGETVPQQLRRWEGQGADLEPVEALPGGWTVAAPRTPEAVQAVGRQMLNCWQNQSRQYLRPEDVALHRVLLDPRGLPAVAFFQGDPRWEGEPTVSQTAGPRNADPTQEAAAALVQYAQNHDLTVTPLLLDIAAGKEWRTSDGHSAVPARVPGLDITAQPVPIGARHAYKSWKTEYGYREAVEGAKMTCATCTAFTDGKCRMFYNARVEPRFTCDEWSDTWQSLRDKEAAAPQDFATFFDQAARGQHAPGQWLAPPTFSQQAPQQFYDAWNQHAGPFDRHIETSIPGYREAQARKGAALAAALGPRARVLDVGSSTGAFGKALSQAGGLSTVSLDPSEGMAESWGATPAPAGAEFAQGAFWQGFGSSPRYEPQGSFDCVNESMTFQFISPDRGPLIAEAKQHLRPGGLLICDEKVTGAGWAENEATKDAWKGQFYDQEQVAQKEQQVGQGGGLMAENLVTEQTLASELRSAFADARPYWRQGNFVGYAASDDPETLSRFMRAMGQARTARVVT